MTNSTICLEEYDCSMTLERCTLKAYLFKLNDPAVEFWCPKSILDESDREYLSKIVDEPCEKIDFPLWWLQQQDWFLDNFDQEDDDSDMKKYVNDIPF